MKLSFAVVLVICGWILPVPAKYVEGSVEDRAKVRLHLPTTDYIYYILLYYLSYIFDLKKKNNLIAQTWKFLTRFCFLSAEGRFTYDVEYDLVTIISISCYLTCTDDYFLHVWVCPFSLGS